MAPKVAFINFANGSYTKLQEMFKKSIKINCPNADVLLFNTFEEIGSPYHKESPYEFKIHSIERARDLGYDIVIWCDSPTRLVKSPTDFIKTIEEHGLYLQKDGWVNGQWANDKTLEWFGVSRDDAMNIPAIYACIIGFDFRHSITQEFIDMWKLSSKNGLFVGNWKNDTNSESKDSRCLGHRHDQSCAELIAHKLKIKLLPLVTDDIFKSWIDI